MARVTAIRLAGVLLLAAVWPWSGSAQQPLFRSGVDLVTIDVTVLDPAGRPIEGLGPDDFILKVDGRPRPVVSAHYVAQSGAAGAAGALAEAHYSSNVHADRGRLILIAVDQGNVRRVEGSAALRAAAGFVDALDPQDSVAAIGLADTGRVDFTRNHRVVREQLARLVGLADPVFLQFNVGLAEALEIGEGSRARLDDAVRRECGVPLATLQNPTRLAESDYLRDPCPEQIEQEARAIAQHARSQTTRSVRALRLLIDRLASIEGPKTLVLLSEGLVAEPRMFDFSELAAAAKAARVTIYVMKLEVPVFDAAESRWSPTMFEDLRLRADGLSRLAGAGRGTIFHLVGSDPRPFRRIALETSAYYLLAFEPLATERDGRLRRIDVSLRAGRATVRGRPVFRVDQTPRLAARTAEEQLARLLRTPRLATELPLSVATYVYKEPGTRRLRVVVSAETEVAAGAAAGATLAFVLLDARNVIVASGVHEAETGRHAFSAVVAPGEHTLKVAVVDRLQRVGSAERPFRAHLAQGGGLEVSDLILAKVPDPPDAPLEPVVDRAPEGKLMAYLELYGEQQPLAEAEVRLEIAETGSGRVLVDAPATLARRNDLWGVARAEVPAGELATGRYVARAEISIAGRPVQHVLRAFRIDP